MISSGSPRILLNREVVRPGGPWFRVGWDDRLEEEQEGMREERWRQRERVEVGAGVCWEDIFDSGNSWTMGDMYVYDLVTIEGRRDTARQFEAGSCSARLWV